MDPRVVFQRGLPQAIDLTDPNAPPYLLVQGMNHENYEPPVDPGAGVVPEELADCLSQPWWGTVRQVEGAPLPPGTAAMLDLPAARNVRVVGRLPVAEFLRLTPGLREWTHLAVDGLERVDHETFNDLRALQWLRLSGVAAMGAEFLRPLTQLKDLSLVGLPRSALAGVASWPRLSSLVIQGVSLENGSLRGLQTQQLTVRVHELTAAAFSGVEFVESLELYASPHIGRLLAAMPSLKCLHLESNFGARESDADSMDLAQFAAFDRLEVLGLSWIRAGMLRRLVLPPRLRRLELFLESPLVEVIGPLREVIKRAGALEVLSVGGRQMPIQAMCLPSDPTGFWRGLRDVAESAPLQVLELFDWLALRRREDGRWTLFMREASEERGIPECLGILGEHFSVGETIRLPKRNEGPFLSRREGMWA
jgi:hypothetical protein